MLIQRVKDIPSLPENFYRIRALLDNNDSDAKALANAIRTDQAISSSILKCANSSHYSTMGHPVGTLTQAITRMGVIETGQIVMASSLLHGFTLPFGMSHIRNLWGHAFAVGLLCKRMAKTHNDLNPEELFMAGLLHDIGRALIGIRLDLNYFESKMANLNGQELIDAEREAYGMNHAEAGAELLRLWNFPQSLQQAVAEHHNPATSFLPAHICARADTEARKRFPHVSSIDQVAAALLGDPDDDAANTESDSPTSG